jgi:hypothetical protein
MTTQGLPLNRLRLAGDIRANNNLGVLTLIGVFMKEHNWQARRFAEIHPDWDDETLFQQARARVIAEIQNIALYEYLPTAFAGNPNPYTGFKAESVKKKRNEASASSYYQNQRKHATNLKEMLIASLRFVPVCTMSKARS